MVTIHTVRTFWSEFSGINLSTKEKIVDFISNLPRGEQSNFTFDMKANSKLFHLHVKNDNIETIHYYCNVIEKIISIETISL